MKRWIFYGSAVLGIAAIAFFGYWKSDRYPILTVNGASVSARDYYAKVRGVERFGRVTQESVDAETVKRGILLSLIADAIVRSELERRGLEANAVGDVDAALAE